MQFLNSVLGSIGGNGSQPLTPPVQLPRPKNVDAVQDGRRTQDKRLAPTGATPQSNKRKAKDGLSGPNDKIVKSSNSAVSNLRAPNSADLRSRKPDPALDSASRSPSKVAVPYRGTSEPKLDSTSAITTSPAATAPPGDAAKAPKKGSYAEIMARAKATQSKPPAVGVISHKAKDKIAISHKKELKMTKRALRDKKLGIKDDSRPGSAGSLSSSPAPGLSKPAKVPKPQPAYKGTAKPKPQPSYKGTMKSEDTVPRKPAYNERDKQASKGRYDEYAATDEDDLDDVEEDEYGSDESDDMEAGFSDVEQEESLAAKAAREEDEKEARLEAQLKKEKEDRRKRLEAMAKKAKPPKY